eukprot:989247-Prymnesium_polylepis.1
MSGRRTRPPRRRAGRARAQRRYRNETEAAASGHRDDVLGLQLTRGRVRHGEDAMALPAGLGKGGGERDHTSTCHIWKARRTCHIWERAGEQGER